MIKSFSNYLKKVIVEESSLLKKFRSVNKPSPVLIKHQVEIHGELLTNNFNWLRTDIKKACQYIKLENRYTDDYFSKRQSDIKGIKRTLETWHESVTGSAISEVSGSYNYFYQADGGLYRQKCDTFIKGPTEVVFNKECLGQNFAAIKDVKISPSEKHVAILLDINGTGQFNCYINEMVNGESIVQQVIDNVSSVEWISPSDYCYTTNNQTSNRVDKVFLSSIYRSKRELLLHEKAQQYSVHLSKSKSGGYIFMNVTSKLSCEVIAYDVERKKCDVIWGRKYDCEAYIDHFNNMFYNLSKDKNGEYCVKSLSCEDLNQAFHWNVIHRRNSKHDYILDIDIFEDDILTAIHTEDLIPYICLKHLNKQQVTRVKPFTTTGIIESPVLHQKKLKFTFTSPIQPLTEYEYDVSSGLMSQINCTLPIWNENEYNFQMLHVKSSDGVNVPISVYHHKNIDQSSANMLCYVYGSYGIPVSVRFNQLHAYLLSKGWIISYCHVRGGNEVGRNWYYSSCIENKENTFKDFESCLGGLHANGYSSPQRTHVHGKSAGGLPIAVLLNRRQDLFKSAVMQVPYISLLDTLLDSSSPLVTQEYHEFGNPIASKEDFNTIKSYCPFYNMITSKNPLFITTALHDDKVPFWVPLQWVAKQRHLHNNNNKDTELLARIHHEGGHQQINFDDALQQDAEIISFLQHQSEVDT